MITVQICIIVLHEVDICYLAKMKNLNFRQDGLDVRQVGLDFEKVGK